ncbi:MAG: hypothetical protein WBV94_13070 [Blastocatellia bacterium]
MNDKDVSGGTVKIQFDLPADRAREVEEMMKLTGVTSRKDLFNNALTLLEWAIGEIYKGNTITSVDEKNKIFRELVMPILSNVAKATR